MKVHNFLGTKMSTFRVNPQNREILAPQKYGRTCGEPVFTHTHTHTRSVHGTLQWRQWASRRRCLSAPHIPWGAQGSTVECGTHTVPKLPWGESYD